MKEWKVISAIVLVIALTALATAVAFASFTRPQQVAPQAGNYDPYGSGTYGYGERERENELAPNGPYGSYGSYPPSYGYPPPQYSYPPQYGVWGGHE